MKRIICLILCFVVMCGYAYADNGKEKTYTLSLEEAIKTAVKNNPQLEVIETKKAAAQISLKSAYIAQADVKNMPVVFGDTQTPLVKKGYYIEAAKANIELLDIEKKQLESNIAYDVTEKYYTYILSEKLVDMAENTVNIANDNLDIVNKYYELGMVAQLEVKNAEANAVKAGYTKDSYVRNSELAKENFKISLNIDEECEFNLTDTIKNEEYASDVNADAVTALETRYDVAALKTAYELSELNFDIVSIYNLPNTANFNNAKSEYIQSEYNYTNNKRLISLMIKSAYNNILTAKENLQTANNDFEIKKLEYEASKVRFEVGSITNTELVQAQNAMSAAEIQLENARLSYLLAVEKYKYEISIGL